VLYRPISEGFGYKLLQKMGWKDWSVMVAWIGPVEPSHRTVKALEKKRRAWPHRDLEVKSVVVA